MYLVKREVMAKRADGTMGKVWEEVPERCPALGWIKEAKCENGVFEFESGYWHDGLVRMNRSQYAHPEGFSLNGAVGHR